MIDDKKKHNDWCDGVLECRDTALLWAQYAENAGDMPRAVDLRRLAEAFRSMVDNEITAVHFASGAP